MRHFLTNRGGSWVSHSKRSRRRINASQTTSLLYFLLDLPVPFLAITVHAWFPLRMSFSMPNKVNVVPFTHMHFPFLSTSVVGSFSTWLLSSLELVSSRVIGFCILWWRPSPTAVYYRLVLRLTTWRLTWR